MQGSALHPEGDSRPLHPFDEVVVTSVQDEIRAALDARSDILALDDRDLTELPGEIGLLHEHLEVLSLSGNRLSKLPVEILRLTKLQELDASNNRLTELPEQIGALIALEQLSVAQNQLTELPASIGQLANLRKLQANNNALRKLPPEIGQLAQLRQLHIQRNQLTALPKEFAKLEALCEWNPKPGRISSPRPGLIAGQNPFVYPPEETIRKGPAAVRDFLKAHPPMAVEQPRPPTQKFVFSLDLETASELVMLDKFRAAMPELKWEDASEGTFGKIRAEGESRQNAPYLWVGLTCREPPGPASLAIILEAGPQSSATAETLKARLLQALASRLGHQPEPP